MQTCYNENSELSKFPLPCRGNLLVQLLFNNIYCLWTFRTIFNLKADFITLAKGFKSIALD